MGTTSNHHAPYVLGYTRNTQMCIRDSVRRAGLDYWDKLDITYYESTAEFFEKNKGAPFYFFSTKARNVHSLSLIHIYYIVEVIEYRHVVCKSVVVIQSTDFCVVLV